MFRKKDTVLQFFRVFQTLLNSNFIDAVNTSETGFSLGILKHASGTPCLAQFGVPE